MGTKRFPRWPIAALALLLTPACAAKSDPSPPTSVTAALGTQFNLAPGSTAHLDDDHLTILFREVSGDSRCPKGATCVWAGDATILTTVTTPTTQSTPELHATPQFPMSATVDGYEIKVIALDPYPRTSENISPADYRVDLLVTRG
ncbi:hypothetical protein AB0N05_13535 [Nocardia sp. NPDC051030]|uniref:hypothetical protein n=1 Tax=Nocardia sp. NPDC051030 TaxID=3155162 RepID=UPI003438DE76